MGYSDFPNFAWKRRIANEVDPGNIFAFSDPLVWFNVLPIDGKFEI